jgi:hypothetical protein
VAILFDNFKEDPTSNSMLSGIVIPCKDMILIRIIILNENPEQAQDFLVCTLLLLVEIYSIIFNISVSKAGNTLPTPCNSSL